MNRCMTGGEKIRSVSSDAADKFCAAGAKEPRALPRTTRVVLKDGCVIPAGICLAVEGTTRNAAGKNGAATEESDASTIVLGARATLLSEIDVPRRGNTAQKYVPTACVAGAAEIAGGQARDPALAGSVHGDALAEVASGRARAILRQPGDSRPRVCGTYNRDGNGKREDAGGEKGVMLRG